MALEHNKKNIPTNVREGKFYRLFPLLIPSSVNQGQDEGRIGR